MSFTESFIRRPVMTVLLNAAIVVAGVIGYRSIPVAALPSYDTPVINVGHSSRTDCKGERCGCAWLSRCSG